MDELTLAVLDIPLEALDTPLAVLDSPLAVLDIHQVAARDLSAADNIYRR